MDFFVTQKENNKKIASHWILAAKYFGETNFLQLSVKTLKSFIKEKVKKNACRSQK